MIIHYKSMIVIFCMSLIFAGNTATLPKTVWYPSVRAAAGGYDAWVATPSTGKEKRVASGLQSKNAALERAVKTAKAFNHGYAPTKWVAVTVPASVRTTCRSATQLICELCGPKSGTCLTYRQGQDELYYTVFGHDTCASTGRSFKQAKASPRAWAERRLLSCVDMAPATGPGVLGDCGVSSKIMCDACGESSATCSSIRLWVRHANPSPQQCTQYRSGMEMAQVQLNRLPPQMRKEKLRDMCADIASNLRMGGY